MKKIIYTLLIIAVMFVLPSSASASEAVCKYGNDNISFTLKANSDESAVSVSIGGAVSSSYALATGVSGGVTAINIQDTKNNLWKCPDKLYYSITVGGRTVTVNKMSFSDSAIDDSLSSPKISESSSDGNKISENSTEVTEAKACKYASLTLTYTSTKMSFTDSSGSYKTSLLFEVGDLPTDACPSQIYLYSISQQGYTLNRYYLDDNEQSGGNWILLNGKIKDATGEDTTTTDPTTTPEYTPVNGCELFGENLTPIIKWAITILKVLVPLLIVVLTIVEFTKIVISAEEKEYKTAITHLIKRIVVGAIIFVLPAIISILIDLSGILNQYGITGDLFCSLFE